MNKTIQAFAEKVLLRSDNGSELRFQGRMFSETSSFDEETSSLIRLRLYTDEEGRLVYSIVSGTGAKRSRRHYVVTPGQDMCRISDGISTLNVPTDMLFASVFGLCGIDAECAEELRPSFEENLRLVAGG